MRVLFQVAVACLLTQFQVCYPILVVAAVVVQPEESSSTETSNDETSCQKIDNDKLASCANNNNNNNNEASCKNAIISSTIPGVDECGIWVAPSTLPGSGVGMYAGKSYQMGEALMADHTIPIVDFPLHNSHHNATTTFLWDEYFWDGNRLKCGGGGGGETTIQTQTQTCGDQMVYYDLYMASCGFGSTANSFLDFVNVKMVDHIQSMDNKLHRFKDPGVGAFSEFSTRVPRALRDIEPGQEFFVNYGNHW
jgi:hypothetical protein